MSVSKGSRDANDRDPIAVHPDGVVWIGDDEETQVRIEGRVEIYDGWVYTTGGMPAWYPRERVREVNSG